MSTIVLVGTDSTPIVGPNAARASLAIVNDGDVPVWLGIGTEAVKGDGIELAPHGGNYEMGDSHGNLSLDAVYAIRRNVRDAILPSNVRLDEESDPDPVAMRRRAKAVRDAADIKSLPPTPEPVSHSTPKSPPPGVRT